MAMFLFFILPILCNTQTTLERQYYSAMNKCITSNSAQTWVPSIVNHHGAQATLVCSQAAICLRAKTSKRMLHHRQVYWGGCTTVCVTHYLMQSEGCAS